MSGLNKVMLIGNLGKDPEMRYMPSGGAICMFPIATSESWTDKGTGERKEKTEWHNITMFNKLAEIAMEYLHKGSKVYVEGKIQTDKWQDNEGKDRYTTKIIGRSMQMLSPKQAGGHGGNNTQGDYAHNQQPQQQSAPVGQAPAIDDGFDDDIPF